MKSNQLTNSSKLLPRREEIVNIIGDHPLCSLDSIARRFPLLSRRTIAYDINHLIKKNFIIKHGDTRGARYSVARESDKIPS